jgi:hypothetical protein
MGIAALNPSYTSIPLAGASNITGAWKRLVWSSVTPTLKNWMISRHGVQTKALRAASARVIGREQLGHNGFIWSL